MVENLRRRFRKVSEGFGGQGFQHGNFHSLTSNVSDYVLVVQCRLLLQRVPTCSHSARFCCGCSVVGPLKLGQARVSQPMSHLA
jgi:hypothetical protein